jgi:hypothetical protein
MRKATILAALLIPMSAGVQAQTSYYPTGSTTLDDRVRDQREIGRQFDELVRQAKQHDAELDALRAGYEDELAHQRAVQYLDPYGPPDRGR